MSEPVQPPDPDRRLFFRQFAKDAATSVGSVFGAALKSQTPGVMLLITSVTFVPTVP